MSSHAKNTVVRSSHAVEGGVVKNGVAQRQAHTHRTPRDAGCISHRAKTVGSATSGPPAADSNDDGQHRTETMRRL